MVQYICFMAFLGKNVTQPGTLLFKNSMLQRLFCNIIFQHKLQHQNVRVPSLIKCQSQKPSSLFSYGQKQICTFNCLKPPLQYISIISFTILHPHFILFKLYTYLLPVIIPDIRLGLPVRDNIKPNISTF